MAFQSGAMIVGLLIVGFAAISGLNGLQTDFGVALGGYRELREVYDIGVHVATAKRAMTGDRPEVSRAANELDAALAKLDRFLAGPIPPAGSDEPPQAAALAASEEGRRLTTALRVSLRDAIASLRLPQDEAFRPGGAQNASIDRAISQVAAIGSEIQRTITARRNAARSKWRATLSVVAIVSGVVVLGGVVLGIYQYRSVISPLRRLGEATRRIAAGHFTDRVLPRGPREFTELADDFNRMAAELESLYRDLEQKVAAKSAELARSERLASVGFLAAGVAHEINNPLSIITGYGERAIQHIELGEGEPMLASVEKCLQVICEEAYRCKKITDQLLSMARPGQENRRPINLPAISREVVASLAGLAEYRDREIRLIEPAPSTDFTVTASEGEMKQVLLNLTVNALDAVPPGTGRVTISFEAGDGRARVIVTDNGRGMTPQTLERIFEPFYTEKRGSNRAGTGLGLSIAHAIIQSHAGTLQATSDGPGTGSRFMIDLPALSR